MNPSTQYWVTAEVYQELLVILGEEGATPNQLAQFQAFFSPNQDATYYQVSDYNGYIAWLDSFLGQNEWMNSEFVSWADYTPGISGQGSGGMNILPLP